MGIAPSVKFLRPALGSKRRQQVATVCYRIRKRGIEFLLVQTRGGRWIFPKGGVEPGLTLAQSAALEAFEEAGVRGRMEQLPFARYFRRKVDSASTGSVAEAGLAVGAYLCEVSRLDPPQEANRNPTWFSAERAQQHLIKDRAPEFGAELARIVDRALFRIERLRNDAHKSQEHSHRDELQEVRFEAAEYRCLPGDLTETARVRAFLRKRGGARSSSLISAAIDDALQTHLRTIRLLESTREIRRPMLRLGVGVSGTADNITAIDRGRRASKSKRAPLIRTHAKAVESGN